MINKSVIFTANSTPGGTRKRTRIKLAKKSKPVVCSEVTKSKFLFNTPNQDRTREDYTEEDSGVCLKDSLPTSDSSDLNHPSFERYCEYDVIKPVTRHSLHQPAWNSRMRHDDDVISKPSAFKQKLNRASNARQAFIATKYLPCDHYTLLQPASSSDPHPRILISSVKRIPDQKPFVVLTQSQPVHYHSRSGRFIEKGDYPGRGIRVVTSSSAVDSLFCHRFQQNIDLNEEARFQLRQSRGNRLPQSDYDHSYHGYPHTSTAAARLALHSTFPPPGGAAGNNNYYSKKTYNRPMTLGMVPSSHNPSTQRSNHLSASSYPAAATGGDYSPNHSDSLPMKPKVVTVVRAGTCRPHKKITILLNRRAVQTYEQLVADISEALGQPKWKNDHIRKLFTLKGREVKSVSDFFREDDCFIAVGREQLTTSDIQDVLRELYPDSPYTESLIQRNLERNFRQQQQRQQANRRRGPPMKGSKSDSGLGDSTEGERIRPLNMKTRASHILNERRRFQEEERLKAKKWEKERWLREQQELNKDASRRRCISQDSVGGLISPPSSQLPPDTRFILENTTRGRGKKKHPPAVSTSSPLRHHLNAWDDPDEEIERKKEEEEERRRRRRMQEEDERRRRLDEEEAKERDRLRREREAIEREKMKILEEERIRKEKEEAEKSRKIREEAERRRKREEDEKAKKRMLEEERKKKLQEAEDRRRREEELEREKKKVEEERRKLEEEKKRIREEEEKRVKEMQELEEKAKKAEEKQKEAEMNAAKEDLKLLNKSDDNDRLKRLQKLKAPPRRVTSRNAIEARYEIGKIIGDGNFAVVRESRLRNTESEYAMKIIDKSKLKGKEDMIENEIAIMKNCHHPNIVRLIEEFETSGEIYLVLEYVKGGDLFDAITESVKFTERDAANMVADLCEALGFLHSKNIIHRDLKPENLLVSRNKDGSMTLKLADFGLAMEVTEPIYTVCGTPTYVAPEILAETGYGLEVDMWAAGVITYILLCGFPPFRSVERDQEELFEVIQLGDYEFLSPYWDSISDAAKDLIQRLLVVDTKRRYTAEQVLAHPWIQSEGIYKGPNLQREITMNLEKNFGERRRRAPRVHPVQ